LFRGWEEETIQPDFSLLDYRGGKGVALHVGQDGVHQGLESLGALLKQPEEKLVAGDHWGLRQMAPTSLELWRQARVATLEERAASPVVRCIELPARLLVVELR
jgi:hypothetical protein